MQPLVVLNPYTDVPDYICEQWASFPPDFEVCCWIGGDITFLPSRNIIDYEHGVAEGYDQKPLTHCSAPLLNSVDRETQNGFGDDGQRGQGSAERKCPGCDHAALFLA